MFYETSYPTCAAGEIATDVGADRPICLTQAEWEAYEISSSAATRGGKGAVNVMPKVADSWTNYAIYGGIALVGLLLISGGRRR